MPDSALLLRLRDVVAESPLSQGEISRRAGQRRTWLAGHLQAWRGQGRRGSDPKRSTIPSLARGLGLTPGELLGEELLEQRERPVE